MTCADGVVKGTNGSRPALPQEEGLRSPTFEDPPGGLTLATYNYEDSMRGKSRAMERVVWIIMGVMVTFVLLSTFHPAVKAFIGRSKGGFFVALVILYLLFLVFSRRIFRQQRLAKVSMTTSRRGFTYTDMSGERILSWRDIRKTVARVDVDAAGQAFVRQLSLQHAKGTVRVDNDPALELPHMMGLLNEVGARLPQLTFRFHWYHALCPFCKGGLPSKGSECPSCGAHVAYVSKIRRPWEMIREENLYIFLILLVAGPFFYPVALAFIASLIFITLAVNRPSRLKPLAMTSESAADEAADDPTPTRNSAIVVAVFAALLLTVPLDARAGPATPSPLPSATASRSPHVDATRQNPLADAVYFPLAVGDTWEYRSNYDTVIMKVTGQEIVNGASCYVMESFVGENTASVQKEYYAVSHGGIEVYKRTHKGSDFFLDTPEPMLAFPLVDGRHWTWQSSGAQGNVLLAFSVMGKRRIPVLGREVPGILVLIRGRSADGTEVQIKRWYCRGIGMVREQTMTKKAGKATSMEATLQNYSLRVGQPAGE